MEQARLWVGKTENKTGEKQMNSVTSRKQELEMKISDLEESLLALKLQLEHQEEQVQHEAIDELEYYFNEINHKYEDFRGFWSILAEEIQFLFKDRVDDKHV